MKQIPSDVNVFKGVNKGYKKSKHQIELEKFIESGEVCVALENYEHKNAYSCTQAIKLAAKRYNMNNIICVTFENTPYLIRKDLAPEWLIEMLGY